MELFFYLRYITLIIYQYEAQLAGYKIKAYWYYFWR